MHPANIIQIASEFRRLLARYRSLPPRRVIEIGTCSGGTLWHWLQNAAPGAIIVTVDNLRNTPWRQSLYRCWAPRSVTVHALLGDSHDPETVFKVHELLGGPIDFVFIDGDHRYAGVQLDWVQYSHCVRPGGLVAFHDILPHPPPLLCEVNRLWEEIKAAGRTCEELIESHSQNWGGIGVVHF